MIQTNMRPYVLFTKYATLNFKHHADEHDHQVALSHTASIASDLLGAPWSGVYSGTKRFNEVFGELVRQQHSKSSELKYLITSQILKPGITTTKLVNWNKGSLASSPEECVSGALADLGKTRTTYGSVRHEVMGRFSGLVTNNLVFPQLCRQEAAAETDPFTSKKYTR